MDSIKNYEVGTEVKYRGLIISLEARWVLRDDDGSLIEDVCTLPVEELEDMKHLTDDLLEEWDDDGDDEQCECCGNYFPCDEGQMTGFHNRVEATDKLICPSCKEKYYYEDDEGIWDKALLTDIAKN